MIPAGADHIETWIFDLDNTLYPETSHFFEQISRRMTQFIGDKFSLDPVAARALQKNLYRRHGTTLRGLMVEHDVAPQSFMAYVHDIDLTPLEPDAAVVAAIAALPGRKFVHTNASARHASRILQRIGLEAHFEDIFDIEAADWLPKPNPPGYETLRQRHGIDPARACMVEDLAINLVPAAAAGMLTVWLDGGRADAPDHPHVHVRTPHLRGWLQGVPA